MGKYQIVCLQFVLMAIVAFLMPSCRFFPQEETVREPPQASQSTRKSEKTSIIFEEPNLPASGEPVEDTAAAADFVNRSSGDSLPKIAIIIDDMGYHQQIGRQLLALDLNLTFSFLPQAPYTRQQEEQAWVKGRDVLLHMPMQAHDRAFNPGPGSLYLKYSPKQMQSLVAEDLNSVPHAIGSNNHMGSGFTEDRAAMHVVLGVLKKRGLFFVDSYTTADSTGLDEARKMSIPTARRHVFLDNVQNIKKICRQLDTLAALARKQGWAIGIGHPHQATLDALVACGPEIQAKVKIVGVHTLVR